MLKLLKIKTFSKFTFWAVIPSHCVVSKKSSAYLCIIYLIFVCVSNSINKVSKLYGYFFLLLCKFFLHSSSSFPHLPHSNCWCWCFKRRSSKPIQEQVYDPCCLSPFIKFFSGNHIFFLLLFRT